MAEFIGHVEGQTATDPDVEDRQLETVSSRFRHRAFDIADRPYDLGASLRQNGVHLQFDENSSSATRNRHPAKA